MADHSFKGEKKSDRGSEMPKDREINEPVSLLLNAFVQRGLFGFCSNYIDCYIYDIVKFFLFLPSLNNLRPVIKKNANSSNLRQFGCYANT